VSLDHAGRVLAPDELVRGDLAHGLEHLGRAVAHVLGGERVGWLHRHEREHLEQVVLDQPHLRGSARLRVEPLRPTAFAADGRVRAKRLRCAVVVHLRPHGRVLRAGTRLEIRVTRLSFFGQYTRLVIREGRAPLRRDRCLMPLSSRPVACRSG
jgi:hypothetical protein